MHTVLLPLLAFVDMPAGPFFVLLVDDELPPPPPASGAPDFAVHCKQAGKADHRDRACTTKKNEDDNFAQSRADYQVVSGT